MLRSICSWTTQHHPAWRLGNFVKICIFVGSIQFQRRDATLQFLYGYTSLSVGARGACRHQSTIGPLNFGLPYSKLAQQMSMQGDNDVETKVSTRADHMRGWRVLPVLLVVLTHLLLQRNVCEAHSRGFSFSGRRPLLVQDVIEYEPSQGGSVSLTMLHRDHEESPLRDAQIQNWTVAQRMNAAVLRSSRRTQSIRYKIQTSAGGRVNGSRSSLRTRTELLEVQSPVFAQLGEFIATIFLGTPKKKFTMILDSGSDLVWVQCAPCEPFCIPNMPHPLFNPTASSSYTSLPCVNDFCNALPYPSPVCSGGNCPFVYEYGDGTITEGEFATDSISLGLTSGKTVTVPNFAFGCGTNNSGDLAGSDGILGVGRGPFSMPSQLGELVGKKFSFCLVSTSEATTKTSPLVIGNDSFLHASGSRWTPLVKNSQNPTYYYVHIDYIKVDGKRLKGITSKAFTIDSISGNGGTIIDTGTTITELLPAAYHALVQHVSANVTYPTVSGAIYGFDICWNTSQAPESGPVFPSITFQMKWKADLDLPQGSAFIEMDVDVSCLCFQSGEGINIIGNMHLQDYHMFVNNDDHVIGWKPADCDKM